MNKIKSKIGSDLMAVPHIKMKEMESFDYAMTINNIIYINDQLFHQAKEVKSKMKNYAFLIATIILHEICVSYIGAKGRKRTLYFYNEEQLIEEPGSFFEVNFWGGAITHFGELMNIEHILLTNLQSSYIVNYSWIRSLFKEESIIKPPLNHFKQVKLEDDNEKSQ